MKQVTSNRRTALPKSFNDLNVLHPLRPLNDDVDLQNAMKLVDHLALTPARTDDQEDFLETLSTLIEKYEREHDPSETGEIHGVDVLRYLLDANEMSDSDLGTLLGDRALGSRIMNGRRELSKAHIRALSERFGLSPAVFM